MTNTVTFETERGKSGHRTLTLRADYFPKLTYKGGPGEYIDLTEDPKEQPWDDVDYTEEAIRMLQKGREMKQIIGARINSDSIQMFMLTSSGDNRPENYARRMLEILFGSFPFELMEHKKVRRTRSVAYAKLDALDAVLAAPASLFGGMAVGSLGVFAIVLVLVLSNSPGWVILIAISIVTGIYTFSYGCIVWLYYSQRRDA